MKKARHKKTSLPTERAESDQTVLEIVALLGKKLHFKLGKQTKQKYQPF